MSNNIPAFELRNFARKLVGLKVDETEAKKLGVEKDYKENEELDVNEIVELALDEDELGELYASVHKADFNKEVAKDKEKEKEEQRKITGKNGAGV